MIDQRFNQLKAVTYDHWRSCRTTKKILFFCGFSFNLGDYSELGERKVFFLSLFETIGKLLKPKKSLELNTYRYFRRNDCKRQRSDYLRIYF